MYETIIVILIKGSQSLFLEDYFLSLLRLHQFLNRPFNKHIEDLLTNILKLCIDIELSQPQSLNGLMFRKTMTRLLEVYNDTDRVISSIHRLSTS